VTRIRRLGVIVACASLFTGCATLQQIAALRHVQFGLAGARDARLAGVPITRIASYRDLGAADVARLALAVSRNELPLDFVLDVSAENPADNAATATMVRLAWTLLLDDRETISGALDSSIALAPGVVTTIPLRMQLNLRQFFDGPAESLIDLAAGLAGARADPTRITLRAVPTIDTPLGPMRYPSPITIVNRTLGGTSP
jgi:hypothetical protein